MLPVVGIDLMRLDPLRRLVRSRQRDQFHQTCRLVDPDQGGRRGSKQDAIRVSGDWLCPAGSVEAWRASWKSEASSVPFMLKAWFSNQASALRKFRQPVQAVKSPGAPRQFPQGAQPFLLWRPPSRTAQRSRPPVIRCGRDLDEPRVMPRPAIDGICSPPIPAPMVLKVTGGPAMSKGSPQLPASPEYPLRSTAPGKMRRERVRKPAEAAARHAARTGIRRNTRRRAAR
jgi:hypothetical protein